MTDQDYMFVTGQLVQGDVFVPQTKNMTGGPLTDLKGNPKVQYFIAVAVVKTDAAMLQEWAKIQQIAQAGFPGGESTRADFTWKVIDGDDPKHASKVGFPGCFVFRFTSGFPVKAYTQCAASQIVDPNQIKRGYFIRVAFTAKANGNAQKPGLYLNTALVELVGYGEEISTGPDAAAVLGAVGQATLPAGASATPVAAGPPLTPGNHGGQAVPPAAVPGAPDAPGAPPPPETGIKPAPDFLNPPVMTAKAGGVPYQQFIDQGWTREALIAEGYVNP